MKRLLWALIPLAVLASCGKSSERKILVVANGDIAVTGQDVKITNISDGAVEKLVDLKNADQTSFTVNNGGTSSTVQLPKEDGFYLLNLMKDTVFGSQLVDGRDYNTAEALGLDKQKEMIDSLKLVLQGKNISEANKNYLVVPGQLTKVTDDLVHARIFGPFHQMNSDIDAPADGKPPVLYKFYSSDELQTRLQTVEESYNATGD
ncbi:hypothetical protein GCM10027566_14340 [Arachidicoccus ginsenosidivorans]|jgi:hypothetical protein|uniref:Uncharacterized protein n=1 Tax=Arachidicoccus ginsenosidivorans TaxID=496057 RepID=A0A5B8VJ59_9BACT|nr:hypothetical protein [Arachidicoccus ginsenosidivorans]QEC71081.1 hypothetical protein FSB73_04680 [Arachidicoccus ginsenosidivorans]